MLFRSLIETVDANVVADASNKVSPAAELDKLHLINFVEAIRGNATLNSPVAEASKSVLLCHLANIAQRTGRTLNCDPTNGHIKNDLTAMALWKRSYEKGWAPIV